MVLNVKISIDDETSVQSMEDLIIESAARQLISEVMNNRYEHYGRTFRDKLKDEVKNILVEVMDISFKEEVKKDIVADLSNKFEKSKQCKEIKQAYEIDSDSIIKSGLQPIIEKMVDAEIRKKFK